MKLAIETKYELLKSGIALCLKQYQIIERSDTPDVVITTSTEKPTYKNIPHVLVFPGKVITEETLWKALRAGFKAVLPLDCTKSELRQAVEKVNRGETIKFGVELSEFERQVKLSPRQLQVLRLAAEGLTSAEIAEALNLKVGYISNVLDTIYQKLAVGGYGPTGCRLRAVNIARQMGLLDEYE